MDRDQGRSTNEGQEDTHHVGQPSDTPLFDEHVEEQHKTFRAMMSQKCD